jgi:hypothetical protein
MKKILFLAALALISAFSAQAQIANTIALWTFETSLPTNSPASSGITGITPEFGSGTASGFHATAVTYSHPAGNGSPASFSSPNWAIGDYYQFQVSTIGFTGIHVSYDQVRSGTGPATFNFQYSLDGSSFTTFSSAYTVLSSPSWTVGTPQPSESFSDDLSALTILDNASSVYFRITPNVAGAVAGTSRIDNFNVFTVVPEPSTLAMTGIGLAGLLLLRRRKN